MLARRLTADGRIAEAFEVFQEILAAGTDPIAVRSDFGWFLFYHLPPTPHPVFDKILTLALKECWIRPETLAERVVRYLAAKWPDAFEEQPSGEPPLGLLTDPLTIALLQATPTATPAFERILSRFRRAALLAVTADRPFKGYAASLTALAIRGWHSGYALVTFPGDGDPLEEVELARRLGIELALGGAFGAGLTEALAVYACYFTPTELHMREALAAGDRYAQALELRVVAPARRQAAIAQGLVPATSFDDSSAVVAAQYEKHPYPAWVSPPLSLADAPPVVMDALAGKAVSNVLIAGCGTGQTSLVAARRWPQAQITALDLAASSIAYAIDAAEQAEEIRVRFVQGDLLRIAEMGQRYQVIEATGVLHHLANPEAGLAALTEALEPGGVMLIALYAARARQRLEAVRRQYGKSATTDDEIRAFRAWALANLDAPEILYSPDFYSVSGCRDLIFHVRERAYTLLQVQNLVAQSGLRFITLNPPIAADKLLARMPAHDDLAGWEAAEREHPNMFGGMYTFWVQKPA